MDNNGKLKVIVWLFAIIFIALETVALGLDSHYKYDFIFIMILLIGMYSFRDHLHLKWGHFLLFSLFLLVHDLGMFKLYSKYPLGIEYDYWVHIFFGIVIALILTHHFIQLKMKKRLVIFTVLIFALGLSAAHELYEFAGALVLGEGEGALFIGAGDLDEWDTQKDMLNNVIGSIIGILLYLPFLKKKRKKK